MTTKNPLRLDHIGIAVRSIAEHLGTYVEGLGLTATNQEDVPSEQVRVAFLPVGETRLELLEATSDTSAIHRFIQRRGQGIHHLCFEVDDIESALASLKEQGTPLVDETPRVGAENSRVAFVHPRGTGGVLIELKEKKK